MRFGAPTNSKILFGSIGVSAQDASCEMKDRQSETVSAVASQRKWEIP
jgi:hypothetical protein